MGTAVILIGEDHAHFARGFTLGGIVRVQQTHVVVVVGHRHVALAAGYALDLVAVATLGVACHVVDHALGPLFGTFDTVVLDHRGQQ